MQVILQPKSLTLRLIAITLLAHFNPRSREQGIIILHSSGVDRPFVHDCPLSKGAYYSIIRKIVKKEDFGKKIRKKHFNQ